METKKLPPAQEAPLELLIGQMLMLGFRGDSIENNHISKDIISLNLGGIILFNKDFLLNTPRNIISPKQLLQLNSNLQAISRYPLFISIDQEGGKIQRLTAQSGFKSSPSAKKMGTLPVEQTLKEATKLGQQLSEININLNFAPVVDVNINPNNPIIAKLERSFSNDPQKVAAHASAFIEGITKNNVICCLKHFPGHGSSQSDTHKEFTDISDTWDQTKELYPYHKLIKNGQADMIMAGHLFNFNIDKRYPATLSYSTITKLLRQKLGFTGVVISDDLQMKAITNQYSLQTTIYLAIQAGIDILLFGNNLTYDPDIGYKAQKIILELVQNGKISRKRLEESYDRIRMLKQKIYP